MKVLQYGSTQRALLRARCAATPRTLGFLTWRFSGNSEKARGFTKARPTVTGRANREIQNRL